MEKAKRARRAETPKQTKPFPKVARAVPLSRPGPTTSALQRDRLLSGVLRTRSARQPTPAFDPVKLRKGVHGGESCFTGAAVYI